MALFKGFLRSKPKLEIPKYKYLVSFVIGLLLAYSLYAIQYITREMIRASSISEDDLWMLSDSEVSFYNLIFAFVAFIMAQSFCFEFLFNQPKRTFNTKPGRLQTIVHEQRFLNWYFLAWFSKVAIMYGLLFCTAGLGDFYIMSFYPDFNYMFILMVVVLFLQTWNGLLLTFKRRAFKWMIVSLLILTTLSFGLSKVAIVDYTALNELVIQKRLDVQYKLRLPRTVVYQNIGFRFRNLPSIALVTPKDTASNQPLLCIGLRKIVISKLPLEILQMRAKQASELRDFMPVFLKIDKEVPMSYVHEVKKELAFVNIQRLNYLVIPSVAKYDKRYYQGSNRTFLSVVNTDYFAPKHDAYWKIAAAVSNKIEVSVSNSEYLIDGVTISLDEFALVLRKRVNQNLDYAIILNFKENVNFGTYFDLVSRIHEAIYSLRDEVANDNYSLNYKTIEDNYYYERTDEIREARKYIMDKYPLRYIEIWDKSGIKPIEKIQPDFALPEL